MAGRTVVVIAHRLSTAERADRVGVVSGGRLVELGTHAELMADEGHYAALFATWATGLAGAGTDSPADCRRGRSAGGDAEAVRIMSVTRSASSGSAK